MMATVESKVRKAHFYIGPAEDTAHERPPAMTDEERKAWLDKFYADFEKLQRNREKVPLEILRTKYADAYGRLTADLTAGVETLLEVFIRTFVVGGSHGFPLHPLDIEGRDALIKRVNGITREETASGGLLDQAKAALIDELDMDQCWERIWRIYDRMEREAFYPYWMRHCWRRNGRIWNDIYCRWWRPERKNESGRWMDASGGASFYKFPPKESAPWETDAIAEMPRCKGCGAPILWYRTADGNPMPCNPVPIAYYRRSGGAKKVLTLDGEIVSCAYDGDGEMELGYIPHWATCPNAADFKQMSLKQIGRKTS